CLNVLETNVLGAPDKDDVWPRLRECLEELVGTSRYAQVYEELVVAFPDYRELVERVVTLVGDALQVGDLGAGPGYSALRLLEANPDRIVTAVEVNHVMLTHLHRRCDEARAQPKFADLDRRLLVVKDDVLRLDALSDGALEAVVMINVLYDVRDPAACLR